MTLRMCANGRNPEAPLNPPTFTSQYHRGELIEDFAHAMINSFQELSWIQEGDYKIGFFWKQKGGMRGEEPVLGTAKKAAGLTGYLSGCTFVIEMAADHCKKLANYEFEAALFHQLLHLGEREVESSDKDVAAKQIPITKPHELEMFEAEIKRYGLWSINLRNVSGAFQEQLKLDLEPRRAETGTIVLGDPEDGDTSFANGDRETGVSDIGNADIAEADDGFDDGVGDEARRRQAMADTVTAKGDGSADIVWNEERKHFEDRRGDIYAAGAIEDAAGAANS